MTVFVYEMRQSRKSIIIWSVTMAAVAFALLSATPLFIDETAGMKEFLAGFPDAVKSAMSIDIDVFFSPVGFYAYIFLYLTLVAAIQAMSVGLGIVSKENRMKTADFLLSKPSTRGRTYRQKVFAALCTLAVTDIALFVSATLSMLYQSGGNFSAEVFALISLTYIFIQLIFLTIGLFLASVLDKVKSPLNLTMGVCFGTFLLGMIASIVGSEKLRYVSPLRYFDNNYIMTHKAYETEYLILTAAIIIVLTVAGYIIYVKKDVKAAA